MNRLKELREAKGLSIHACAKAAGLTPPTLFRAEKGERKISTAQAVALSKFFGVTIEYLLGLDDSQEHFCRNRLRELRKERGLSLRELADKVGIGYSALAYIERAEHGFSVESLIRTCDFFGVSTDYMLGLDDSGNEPVRCNRLRELRMSAEVTTVELGKAVGVDPSMITHIERGDKNFSVESLIRTCDFFGVSTDYMLCRDDNRIDMPPEIKRLVEELYHILFPAEAKAKENGAADTDEAAATTKADSSAQKKCNSHLRELRKEKGLTSNQLAEILGLSGSSLRCIESGIRGFSTESLQRACDFFGVSADYMLGRTEERK